MSQVVEQVVYFSNDVRHSLVDFFLQHFLCTAVIHCNVHVVCQVLRVMDRCQFWHLSRDAADEQLVQQAAMHPDDLGVVTKGNESTVSEVGKIGQQRGIRPATHLKPTGSHALKCIL